MHNSIKLFLTILALSSLPVATAQALPDFPEEVQDATGAPCPPRCTLCHADESPSEDNLTRPFGKAFLARDGEENRERAIQAMRTAGVDSDGDGEGDIDELAAGQDPNSSFDVTLCGPEVGCSVGGQGASASLGLSLLAILGYLTRRRVRHR